MVPGPLLWQHAAKETASAKKKCTTLLKKNHLQICLSCMFCTRNIFKILSSDVLGNLARTVTKQQQQPACITWFCSSLQKHNTEGHQVDVEWVMPEAKLNNKGYILTAVRYYHICPHAVQTRSTLHQLITTCRVKAQLLVLTSATAASDLL